MNRENSNKRTWIFEEAPIAQAVFTMAIPTIITQLINIVYNFADSWYVGRTESAAMMAALSVSLPIFIIIQALANLFGIGGASAISRALGRKEVTRARKIFAFSLYGGLMAAIIYAAVVFFARPLMIPLIGGSEDSYRYIYDYMFWTMVVGAIPTLGNALCGHLVRSIGAAKEAGFGLSMGGILNIILDPLFMFVLLTSTDTAITPYLPSLRPILLSMREFRVRSFPSAQRQPCRLPLPWFPISSPTNLLQSTEVLQSPAWASPKK